MRWFSKSVLSAAVLMPTLALADEKPARAEPQITVQVQADEDNSTSQQKHLREALEHMQRELGANVKREKGAYLGVSASPAPTVLRKHLGLKPGVGLIVNFVDPNSPAAKAGVQQDDILHKLDDQLLINAEQMAILVRSHKVGDEVHLAVIHDGKPLEITVKLAEHELEPLAEFGQEPPAIWRMIPEPHMQPPAPGQWPHGNPRPHHALSTTWIENDRSYTVTTTRDNHRNFTVKDKDGKTLFDGPIDTKEQRDKLPPELKEKLEKLQQMPGAPATQPGK